MSTVNKEKLTDNLQLVSHANRDMPNSDRPTVILFSWLLAKGRHVSKYGDYYLDLGFDVLNVKVNPRQLMWPVKSQKVIRDLIEYLDAERKSSELLVHGFSVGAYLYGEMLNMLDSMPKYGYIHDKIMGQVLDSPADVHVVPEGVSKAVTPILPLQKILKFGIDSYMSLFHQQVTQHYLRSSSTFLANRLEIPTMFLYSTIDPVGEAAAIEKCVHNWRRRGISVFTKCWDDSPHVSHMMYHPEEYLDSLTNFLAQLRPLADMMATKTPDRLAN